MSLLQSLSYKEYQRALRFNIEQCQVVANLAEIKNITFENTKKPGQLLIKTLDRNGISLELYKSLIATIPQKTSIKYSPDSKVAIIIGNDLYVNLNKLATPEVDCSSLSTVLKNLGFNVIILRNTTSKVLKAVLKRIFAVVPKDSYCFIFYAGHGCEVNETTCMMSVDCPMSNVQLDHCITQNEVLEEVAKCNPDLCVFIMDMCRINLDRSSNEDIYNQIANQNEQPNIKNLIICYSTIASQQAYEAIQMFCSNTIDSDMTYELDTKDFDRIVPEGSQYVNVLCKNIACDFEIGVLMDKVHREVEKSVKLQKPIKLEFGELKRSLNDPAIGDSKVLLNKLKEIGKEFYEVL